MMPRTRSIARALCAVVALALLAPMAGAQGAPSVLGFGYPVGGMSSRTLGTGTSMTSLDPQSPVNPASIVLNARMQGYVQYEPEFRTVRVGGNSVRTSTSRFPIFMVTGRSGRATFGISYSAFLDRTWANSYVDTQVVSGEKIGSTVITQSTGGITDARLAASWTFSEKAHVGIGLHLFPGQNGVVSGRIFSDSSRTGSFSLNKTYNFTGSGVSLGGVFVPFAHLVIGSDLRVGGTLLMRDGDTTEVGRAKVPFRASVSALYDGVSGATFSLRLGTEKWSDMRGLGSASLPLRDATDISLGTEITGPRYGGVPVFFRGGFRTRGLPVAYGTAPVKETSFSGGIGVPIASGRSQIDLGIVRADRSTSGVSEKAWLVSFGVGIRP
jgi:hypothetical protein